MIIFLYKDFTKNLTRNPEFRPIFKDWGKLEIADLAQMPLMNCYLMLQNARVTAFIVSELLRET